MTSILGPLARTRRSLVCYIFVVIVDYRGLSSLVLVGGIIL